MNASYRASLPSGVSIGSFEPLFELGRGGMGTALLARAVGVAGFERLVVIKRLHPHMLDRVEAVNRFLDEARVAAHIRHANVVATHLVGTDEDGHFLVLDYVEGASLEELVDRVALKRNAIPPPIVLRIGLDALAGLHAAHEARDTSGQRLELLHRDVSIQNVLVGRDGVARVSDFGIAKSAIASVQTDKQYIVGKLMYLPPEYLRREAVGPDFDVYSLGLTLWIALAGTTPWPEDDDAKMVTQILINGVPRISTVMSVAPQLDDLLAKACAMNRADRFPSARAMMDAIEHIGRHTGWLASHAEVSDFVESLMGADLKEREKRVTRRLKAGTDPELPIPLRKPVHTPGNEDVTEEVIPVVKPRPLWPFVLGALVLLGFLCTWLLVKASTPVQAEPSPPPPAPTPSAAGLEIPTAPPAPTPSVAPAPSAVSAPERPQKPKTIARPVSAPTPAPTPQPAPTATATSDGISKKNPYRK